MGFGIGPIPQLDWQASGPASLSATPTIQQGEGKRGVLIPLAEHSTVFPYSVKSYSLMARKQVYILQFMKLTV